MLSTSNINELAKLIARLRDPKDGCPWDIKQNLTSLSPCILEECYELIEAIRLKDDAELRAELGDVLMLVIMMSQIASEENKFNLNDVIDSIQHKLISRHPHVFKEGQQVSSAKEALMKWEDQKQKERNKKSQHSILDDIPHALPALMRAQKIQKRCAKVGFDWQDLDGVMAKLFEEIEEVKVEIEAKNKAAIAEELGDLLFACVNLTRHLDCSAEEVLAKANIKFEQRFRLVEEQIKSQNKTFEQLSLAEMDDLWNQIKLLETK